MLSQVMQLRRSAIRAVFACFFAACLSGAAFSQSIECPVTSNTSVSFLQQETIFLGSAPSCVIEGNGTTFTTLTVADGGALLNQQGVSGKPVTMVIDNNGSLQNSGYFQNFATTSSGYAGSTVTNFGAIYNNTFATLDTTDGTLTNAGNLENFGTIDDETGGGGTLNNAGRLVNETTGGFGASINVTTVTNAFNASIENDSSFQASSLTNNGTFTNTFGAALTLTGPSTNNGTITNAYTFDIYGQLQNNGTLKNNQYGLLTIHSGGILNAGAGSTLTNGAGIIDVLPGGSLNNATGGTLTLGGEILFGGTMNAGSGVQLDSSVALYGTGTINGNLVDEGEVAPSALNYNQADYFYQDLGPGTLTINGNYTQNGFLNIGLYGTGAGDFDVLDVSGLASLDGTVGFTLFNGLTLAAGDDFTFLNAGSVSGDLAGLDLNVICPTGLVCDLVYGANSVSLDITAASSGGNGGNGGGTTNAPEPSSLWLLGAAFLALVAFSRTKRFSAAA